MHGLDQLISLLVPGLIGNRVFGLYDFWVLESTDAEVPGRVATRLRVEGRVGFGVGFMLQGVGQKRCRVKGFEVKRVRGEKGLE